MKSNPLLDLQMIKNVSIRLVFAFCGSIMLGDNYGYEPVSFYELIYLYF